MKDIVLIRPQPALGAAKAMVYHFGDREEKVAEGPRDPDVSLKHYVRGIIKDELTIGRRQFVLDLESVEWIDSIYVGMILAWQQLIHERDGQLVLVNPSKRSKDVLKATRLDTVLNVRDTMSDAQRYFVGDAT
jgi:anti-anti-sigma factor